MEFQLLRSTRSRPPGSGSRECCASLPGGGAARGAEAVHAGALCPERHEPDAQGCRGHSPASTTACRPRGGLKCGNRFGGERKLKTSDVRTPEGCRYRSSDRLGLAVSVPGSGPRFRDSPAYPGRRTPPAWSRGRGSAAGPTEGADLEPFCRGGLPGRAGAASRPRTEFRMAARCPGHQDPKQAFRAAPGTTPALEREWPVLRGVPRVFGPGREIV
jgi:hypothetical protein